MQIRDWEHRDPSVAFFPVELRPLFMQISKSRDGYRKLQRHFAVVDVKSGRPFSVVTNDYELITNEEAYERAAAIMKMVFQVTRMDDMVCLNITMPKTRSFCHIDLVHRGADFSPWENDKWTAFLRITNSYNRTRLLRFELGFCRWICLNGMILGRRSIEFSYAHTRQGIERISRFAENIGDIRKLETELIEKLHQLKRYYIARADMLAILCRVFDLKVSQDDLKKQKLVEGLRAIRDRTTALTEKYFSEMGAHGYAALNVLTDFASRPVGVVSPESRMNGYQKKCGAWIDAFISSIKDTDFSFDGYLADYRQSAELMSQL